MAVATNAANPSPIEHSHIRENLAVEINAGHLEAVDQLVVGDAVIASGGADTLNPQRAVVALARTSVAIGISQRTIDGFFRGPK